MASYNPANLSPDELACPICFEDFSPDLKSKRLPKLLLCLHTFCLGCIRSLVKDNRSVQCSMCRTDHKDVFPQDLPDNYVIIDYLKKLQLEKDEALAREEANLISFGTSCTTYLERQTQLLKDAELARQFQRHFDEGGDDHGLANIMRHSVVPNDSHQPSTSSKEIIIGNSVSKTTLPGTADPLTASLKRFTNECKYKAVGCPSSSSGNSSTSTSSSSTTSSETSSENRSSRESSLNNFEIFVDSVDQLDPVVTSAIVAPCRVGYDSPPGVKRQCLAAVSSNGAAGLSSSSMASTSNSNQRPSYDDSTHEEQEVQLLIGDEFDDAVHGGLVPLDGEESENEHIFDDLDLEEEEEEDMDEEDALDEEEEEEEEEDEEGESEEDMLFNNFDELEEEAAAPDSPSTEGFIDGELNYRIAGSGRSSSEEDDHEHSSNSSSSDDYDDSNSTITINDTLDGDDSGLQDTYNDYKTVKSLTSDEDSNIE